jgi:hypothetical protein
MELEETEASARGRAAGKNLDVNEGVAGAVGPKLLRPGTG